MDSNPMGRRHFLGRIAAALGGLAAVAGVASTAQAGSSKRRFRGGWGYPGYYRGSHNRYRGNSHRRYYGPGYGGGYYGGGYAPGRVIVPGPGYYAPPRVYVPPAPVYYGPGGGYYPLSQAGGAGRDLLALLEA